MGDHDTPEDARDAEQTDEFDAAVERLRQIHQKRMDEGDDPAEMAWQDDLPPAPPIPTGPDEHSSVGGPTRQSYRNAGGSRRGRSALCPGTIGLYPGADGHGGAHDVEGVEEQDVNLAYSRLSRAILWVHNQCRHCPEREA